MATLALLSSKLLTEFPSGSSINFRDGRLYLIGDDASTILILDKEYNQVQSLELFNYPEKRIPKSIKADLEASTFVTIKKDEYFLLVGSASKPQREKVFLIPLVGESLDMKSLLVFSDDKFTDRLKRKGIEEVNMEGITLINNHLILCNRGNRKNPLNHFLITEVPFWEEDKKVDLKIIPVQVSSSSEDVPSISELCYYEATDTLLLTLSTEASDNAYDDGAIGNSYIGIIPNISKKLDEDALVVTNLINLPEVHPDFNKEKIEGICIESSDDNNLVLHLISDNDNGESKLFKVSLTL